MALVYVAKSAALQDWGSDVGISKNIFKVGLIDDVKADAAKVLNDAASLGQTDWKIIAKRDVPEVNDEDEILGRLATRLKVIDPTYYPKLKGARCIVKVNSLDVDRFMVFRQTAAGEAPKVKKQTPADVGNYLIENALP